MSDDDDFMMDEGGDEEYDFDYEDEDDDQEDVDTDMENKYYQAKNYKSDNQRKLWPIGDRSSRLKPRRTYTELLDYCKTAVTRNAAEKAINGILDYVGMAQDLDISLMQQWYEVTQNALQAAKNEVIEKLRMAINAPNSNSSTTNSKMESFEGDNSIGTLLLEVLAIEIQMYTDRKENKKLREIYDQTLTVKSTIPHPKIMGIIRGMWGGKMHMSEKNWTAAHYKQDPQIVAMTNLVAAYQRQDVHEAEKIIKNNRATILDDPFIAIYIQDVLTSLRTQWILGILQSYQRIEIAHVARQLKISDIEVEEIMLLLILDGKIAGKLDQLMEY
ncbi:hypothetical protein Pst134EA_007659 [Puccinia striiformis f. sp. tritici]|uniref:hypothetical protein n=1 Tax=Puccinia striiformis f. sp. tritici TaxID=168172 RepID=UPI0020086782|nr:hypothetical protein Pst134EA_007659 [Puccinia striiformis f. sp. tritici]KAH9470399.1 hypothetical protein Pst134EA_007659 [Puccinia striiformis f. sp. tritici]